ncbi:MAG TPA: dihydroorotase [Syntrophales bacterium]|nr:dihydroorotase [Syntrophales bacterium]HOX95658.1 dihydroorotase [Syntrophales bacterium]HPI56744.1 dihydroorotase [Syntrophales bacterium]HPN24831.1 dihydroorotase [Syntrophales bacterium]HQM30266.1 dihydroorotase [Syntrophales bacterium]
MSLLIKGGRVVDPSQGLDAKMDILVENGKISKIGKDLPDGGAKASRKAPALQVIDARNLLVLPGLVDMHTHLREPGYEYKETIETGSQAALAGGFTSIACMPNTDPINDNRSVTEFIIRQAAKCGLVNVYPVAAISKGSEGKGLTEFGDLVEAGAVAFSDDGKPVMTGGLMRRALEYAGSFGTPILSHCEDATLSAGGLMNEGLTSTELGLPGIPSISEEVMVARDILIAAYTEAALHICHVSTAGSVDLIRDAKRRGVRVTAETAPHYFCLSEEALTEFDTRLKMNPPLRSTADVAAIKKGLGDGTLDAIATDHAPQSPIEKEVEFEYAANGIIGLETSLGLSLRLVDEGVLTIPQLVERMSLNPAKILRLNKGTLKPGADADIAIIDPGKVWTVDVRKFRSKSRNSPFGGWPLKGKVTHTIVGGIIKYTEQL